MSQERLEDFVRQMVRQVPTRLFVQTLLVLDGAEKYSAEAKAKLSDKVAAATGARTAAECKRQSCGAEGLVEAAVAHMHAQVSQCFLMFCFMLLTPERATCSCSCACIPGCAQTTR